MTVYFTSDLHLGHAKIAELRGFEDTEAHDDHVMSKIRHHVKKGDQLWILGDISSGSSSGETKALELLRFHPDVPVHLIAGNHDAVHPMRRDSHKHQARYLATFASVQPFARRRVAGKTVLLSHFPYSGDHTATERYSQYRLRDEGEWLMHGHTHSAAVRSSRTQNQIHIGWDAWHGPVPLAEIEGIVERGTA